MSTKPIREALLKMGKAPNTPEEFSKLMEAQDAALDAVRAIEEMARALIASGDVETIQSEGRGASAALLESIAKEAP